MMRKTDKDNDSVSDDSTSYIPMPSYRLLLEEYVKTDYYKIDQLVACVDRLVGQEDESLEENLDLTKALNQSLSKNKDGSELPEALIQAQSHVLREYKDD
jgi:hypothetical protein